MPNNCSTYTYSNICTYIYKEKRLEGRNKGIFNNNKETQHQFNSETSLNYLHTTYVYIFIKKTVCNTESETDKDAITAELFTYNGGKLLLNDFLRL